MKRNFIYLAQKMQDINLMMFCEKCKMNCFPGRPRFNNIAFGICTGIVFIIVLILISSLSFLLGGFLFFLYFMWGFMVLNPYLIIYGLKKKRYCPRCHEECSEKNLDYQPFGDKEPEIFKSFAFSKMNHDKNERTLKIRYCPHCGKHINHEGRTCKACGRSIMLGR